MAGSSPAKGEKRVKGQAYGSETMPKLIPVPDASSKPFWDAVNQRRLVLQHCAACNRLQYPPQQACQFCNSAAGLTWKEVEGRGHIATTIVIEDGRLNRRMPDQPYNLAMVTLGRGQAGQFLFQSPRHPALPGAGGRRRRGDVRGGRPRPAHPRVAGRRLAMGLGHWDPNRRNMRCIKTPNSIALT